MKKKFSAKRNSRKSTVSIYVLSNSGPGIAKWVKVPQGTTVADTVWSLLGQSHPEHCLIRVNRKAAHLDYILRDGDRITATPIGIRGEAQMPPLTQFVKYLKKLGFRQIRQNGSHIQFKNSEGRLLTVVPGRQRKEVSFATIKQAVQVLNIPLNTLFMRIG